MRSRLGLVFCMIAGLQLLGGHWALLQTAAWVGMVIDYSKTGGVEAGITKAFDGKHPCELCLSIREEQGEGGQANGKSQPCQTLSRLPSPPMGPHASSGVWRAGSFALPAKWDQS